MYTHVFIRVLLFPLFLVFFSFPCFVSVLALFHLWVCLLNKTALLSYNNHLIGTSNAPTVKPFTISTELKLQSITESFFCCFCTFAHSYFLIPVPWISCLTSYLSLISAWSSCHQNCLTVALMSPPLKTSDAHLHITNCSENRPLGLTSTELHFASVLCDHQ